MVRFVLGLMLIFDDPPSILFISVECITIPRFVELAHTLNHLQKLHCVVVDEAHLLLLDFKPIMKAHVAIMGCGMLTFHIDSLFFPTSKDSP
jgi:hypothetical protein